MCAQRNNKNLRFTSSPKMHLLLGKGWASGESMLLLTAPVGESKLFIIQYTTQNLAGTYMLITARPVVLAGRSLCLTMPVCFRKMLWKKYNHRTLISWLAADSVALLRRQKSLRPVKKLGRYNYANYSSPSSASGPLSVSYDTCLFWEDVVKKI